MAFAAQAEISTASNAGRRTLPMTTPIFFKPCCTLMLIYIGPLIFYRSLTGSTIPCNNDTQSGIILIRHTAVSEACPLYPRKRTLAGANQCPLCANFVEKLSVGRR